MTQGKNSLSSQTAIAPDDAFLWRGATTIQGPHIRRIIRRGGKILGLCFSNATRSDADGTRRLFVRFIPRAGDDGRDDLHEKSATDLQRAAILAGSRRRQAF